ncbi:hypothetical protein PtA15_17A166 [Puccinia triticina]|uniref:Uncharacterized protein n=1 Tax=Puccinia triticina TaxID=208348 RepID=A0ABY7D4Y1_9BASI|nr:uncharacterized protein PtA15_17A166 [Puccinia triticina]WAQ92684.1 hypothetical protein PtA15_17A166 [Puccinia triticina]
MARSISILAASLALLIGNIHGQVAMTFMYGQTNGLTGKGFGTMDGAPRDISTITKNPITRDANLFDDAMSKMSPKDLQALTSPPAKGKRRSLLQLRR